jgi:predicted component of type VI protein secretion system
LQASHYGGFGMAEREFRLPGSPYEELVNIIVAYGTREDAARTGDVGKLDSVHQSSVSRNNAFLVEIGVLQGESRKMVTRRGRELAAALARKDREEIRNNWRALVAASEFLQNVVSAVKLREGMLYPTVQAYIAHAAGQPRNKPVMNGAGAIVEILKAAGMLREEAGELVATFDEQPKDTPQENGQLAKTPAESPPVISATVGEPVPTGMQPAVSIHVQVRCTADEIEELAPRLKALVRELSTED